jgi:hypothetical protein
MTSLALLRARVGARSARPDTESGFALIYVLAITTMIATLVGSTLVVTTSSVVPAVQAAYSQAADAAAQSGVQDFVTRVDTWCGDAATSSVSSCTLHTNVMGPIAIALANSDGSYSASYSWKAVKDPSNRYIRVESTGVVKEGGVASTKVVIGDIVPGNSLNTLNYGVVTGFETQSSSTVLADWPSRTIHLDDAAVNAADDPIKGNSVDWSGTQPGAAAGSVSVCNATFDAKGGRSNNAPPNPPNPYVDVTETGDAGGGNHYTNYLPCHTSWGHKTELLAPADKDGAEPGGYQTADALLLSNSFPGGTGPVFNQQVWSSWQYTSQDANVCGTQQGQSYRSFTLICPGYKYTVEVGGSPSPNSAFPELKYKDPAESVQVPSTVNYSTVPDNRTCTYNGPTRVVLHSDNTAVVTSPQTTATFVTSSPDPSSCYVGAGAQGMAQQTVDLSNIALVRVKNNGNVPTTTPAIAHGSTGWPVTGQQLGNAASTTNSVFYLTNGTSGSSTAAPVYTGTATDSYSPQTGDNPSTKTDGSWNLQWTSYTNSGGCSSSTSLSDLKFFNCYVPTSGYSDAYSWVKAQVKAALAANPSNYTTAAQLQSLVNSFVSQGNSSDAANAAPTKADYTSHRWTVSAGTTTVGSCAASNGVAGPTSDTPLSAPSDDPFFQNTAGNAHAAASIDTSCVNIKVTLQIGTCSVALVLGVCANVGNYAWGNGTALLGAGQSVAQFQLTVTVKKSTTTTTTVAGQSTFPSMSDVTQYQMGFDNTGNGNTNTFGPNGPGDLYVQGEAGHTMALIGDDDVAITGAVGPAGSNPANPSTTQDNRDPDCGASTGLTCPVRPALEIVARNNVRIYHPVKCNNAFGLPQATFQSEVTATSPGFCPNDITGLYDTLLSTNEMPSQQYANLRPDLAGMTIHGALYALGNATAHITCPQPPDGGGTCGGEVTTDNYNRGDPLGYVTEIGALGMSHHAPVGEEWETADATGATSRSYSGYQLAQQFQDLKALLTSAGLDGVLSTSTATTSLWHILSVSAVTGSS